MAKRAALDIKAYNRKRDFKKTREPRGRKLKGKGDSFVVQKHDASRLHWDFRLELDGVLKSWAVPKGPSLDPDDKRLAMRTEDHPLDYGGFEGTIPKGEYGGGTVMLWDQGRWIPDPRKDPKKTIEEGHLHFTLEGERMKGEWVLFRLNPRPGEKGQPWMLKKVTDEYANPDDGDALIDYCVTSVTTGRTMAEIASGSDVWRSNRGGRKGGRARKKSSTAPPAFQEPQLATLVDGIPTGSGWIHEYKYDGYRLLIATGEGAATVWTRNGKDWSDRFRALVKAASALPAGCLIDGEAVAIDDEGKLSFQLLQSTLKEQRGANLVFYAFDLLVDRGEDIKTLGNLERKQRLSEQLKHVRPPILYGDHVEGQGKALLEAICKARGEGVVSKRANAAYRNARTRNWLKIKCGERQEFVIVGWTKSEKQRGFRSLLLGLRERGKLKFAGKVGTGFAAKTIEDLLMRMKPLEQKEPALEVPRAERKGAHWIEPKLVAEIAFTEFTSDGILRHPSYLGLREDKPATEVVRERPAKLKPEEKKTSGKKQEPRSGGKGRRARRATAEDFGIEISNSDRVIYPGEGITKKDLADYYATVEPLLMVDAAMRPITLIRCPRGAGEHCFFQKHDSGSMSEHVKQIPVKEKDGSVEDYLYFEDVRGVLAAAQMGTIEFHGWGSKVDNIEHPDRLVFDLDPDVGLDFVKVKEAAVRVRDLVEDLGLKSFPLLTGGKGIHVVIPLDRTADWKAVKSFAGRFSRAVAEAEPERFTANIRKVQRKGRIFLDWLRNQRGATAVLPYSARARKGAPVAAPVTWNELDDYKSGSAFSIRDAGELLHRASLKRLAGWGKAKQALPRI